MVFDPGNLRATWFDDEGRVQEDVSFATAVSEARLAVAPRRRTWQIGDSGALLSTAPARALALPPGNVRNIDAHPVVLSRDGGLHHDFGDVPSQQLFAIPATNQGMLNVFAPATHVALGGVPEVVATSAPDRWEVTVYGPAGGLRQILRASAPAIAMAEARAGATPFLESQAERLGFTLEQLEEGLDDLDLPDSLPPIGSLQWDGAGRLWVGRRRAEPTPPDTYDVMSPRGAWLGTLTLPPDFGTLLEIGEDYVLSDWRDALGVAYLRVHQLRVPDG